MRLIFKLWEKISTPTTTSNHNDPLGAKGYGYDAFTSSYPHVRERPSTVGNGPTVLGKIWRTSQASHPKKPWQPVFPARPSTSNKHEPAKPERAKIAVTSSRAAPSIIGRTRRRQSIAATVTGMERSSWRTNATDNSPLPSRGILKSPTPVSAEPVPPRLRKSVSISTPPLRELRQGRPSTTLSQQYRPAFFSRRPSVDVVEAYSILNSARETTQVVEQALGARSYGEDVANRNLKLFVGNTSAGLVDRRSSPTFTRRDSDDYTLADDYDLGDWSETRSAAAPPLPSNRHSSSGSDNFRDQALGRAEGARSKPYASSLTRVLLGAPNPAEEFGTHSITNSETTGRGTIGRGTHRPPTSTVTRASVYLKPPPESARASKLAAKHSSLTGPGYPPIQRHALPVPATPSRQYNPTYDRNVSTSTNQHQNENKVASMGPGNASHGVAKRYSHRAASLTLISSTQNNPCSSGRSSSVANQDRIIEEDLELPPTPKGIVYLGRSTGPQSRQKPLPVPREENSRLECETEQEVITREIHHHHVYHHMLPVMEKEIVPEKGYMSSPKESRMEITETRSPSVMSNNSTTLKIVPTTEPRPGSRSLIRPCRRISEENESASEASNFNFNSVWQDRKSSSNWSQAFRSRASSLLYPTTTTPTTTTFPLALPDNDAADSPTVPLNRDRDRTADNTLSRGSTTTLSRTSMTSTPDRTFYSTKTNVTDQVHPRTDYVWHHPPAVEESHGRTLPVYIGAGLGDLSSPITSPSYCSSDDDFSLDIKKSSADDEGLLFSDGGYGAGGMLPGLDEQSPTASSNEPRIHGLLGDGDFKEDGHRSPIPLCVADAKCEKIVLERVPRDRRKVRTSTEAEEMRLLRRIREDRQAKASNLNGVDMSFDLLVLED